MENNLGEIFYNGRIINLRDIEEAEAEKILNDLRNTQVNSKRKISICLDKMKNI